MRYCLFGYFKIEGGKMPVFIYEDDAFEKLCHTEGPEYYNQRNSGICSFGAFAEKWRKQDKTNPSLKSEYPNITFDVEGNNAIYGLGGWNRYVVCFSGEIMISWRFIEPFKIESLLRALKVGFRVWPDEIGGDIEDTDRSNKMWWLKRIFESRRFKKKESKKCPEKKTKI